MSDNIVNLLPRTQGVLAEAIRREKLPKEKFCTADVIEPPQPAHSGSSV